MANRKAKSRVIDPRASCYLFCLPDLHPPELAVACIGETLAALHRKGDGAWVIAAGRSPSHWAGLTQWVLVSDTVPASAIERVRQVLRETGAFDGFESNELTTLANEPFARPVLVIDDAGVSHAHSR